MRIKLSVLSMVLVAAMLSSACIAASKAETMKFESFWKSDSPIIVSVTTEKDCVAKLQFPAMPKKKGMLPVVRFKAYLNTPLYAGWSHYMSLDLNGKPLGPSTDGLKFRLVNREKLTASQVGSNSTYLNDALLTFFGPAGSEVDPRITSDRDEGYWYLLDVSDVVNNVVVGWDDRIESQDPNNLVITNTYRLLSTGETADCKEFVIENLEAGYLLEDEVNSIRRPELISMKSASGPILKSGDGTITVDKNGALELKVGSESYHFAGLYSYPSKDKIQYNSMGMPNTSKSEWKISSSLNRRRKKLYIKGDYKTYNVSRTIVADGGKFRVYDKITNKTNKPLGMEIRYNTITNDAFSKDGVFLCGSGALEGTDNCGTNPSIFIKQASSSMGLVVEDTLFRLQMEVLKKDNSIEYATKHFGLDAKKSYTIEWTIYPSKITDYWDFVNNVRKDWNVNYTLLGPCPLADEYPSPGRNSLLYAMKPWYDYVEDNTSTPKAYKMMTPEVYKSIVMPKIKKLLDVQPDAIPMGMLNTNLVPFDTREFGGNIPQGTLGTNNSNGTGYGYELNFEQTNALKKSPWWDSIIKTSDGRAVIDTYYAPPPFANYLVYPVVGNSQFKFMLSEIDLLMDQCGMKGIFLDQFNLAGTNLKKPGRCDYSKWDGHTVDLKDNGEIDKMFTDGTYVGAPARAAIIRYIIKKGGVAMVNGHNVEKETRELPLQSFAESEWDLSSAEDLLAWSEPPYMPSITEGLLSSPIALGMRPGRFGQFGEDHWAEIIQKWVITCLKNGSVYCYYSYTIPTTGPGAGEYGIMNHMFPFTPIELHAGTLIGKERILTAKSGSFFWNNVRKPIILAFDSKGYKIKPKNLNVVQKGKGWQVDLSITDWQETAVIKDPLVKDSGASKK